jgi:phospholipid/cholesterol/gamma-HCH transport system ATP-binding protein
MIEIVDLRAEFNGKVILNKINLKIEEKEIFVILGPSGCGKSVLLKNMIGLNRPNRGKICVDGEEIKHSNKKSVESFRKKCGFLFQHSALFDSMTIEENLAFPLLQHSNLSKKDVKIKIDEKLKLVGLNGVNSKKPSELSGGMQKRAALARSIILDPKYIFYDEPTTGLDPIMSRVIDDLIKDLNTRLGATSIVVTHDMKTALRISDKICLLYGGEIIVNGDLDTVLKLKNPYLTQFIEGEKNGPINLT